MLSILRNKFVIGAIVLVVLFGAWYGLTSSSAPASVLTSASPDASPGDQDIVATLVQLQAITLSGTIFSNPAYQSLQDDTVSIQSEPVGRSDPFAPTSYSAPVTGSAQSAQIFQK